MSDNDFDIGQHSVFVPQPPPTPPAKSAASMTSGEEEKKEEEHNKARPSPPKMKTSVPSWAKQRPPRPSPTSSSPSAPAANNNQRSAELEALRQRGLAKLFHLHFTETAAKLAKEKAAADAALRDLQERKAGTSEFTASGNGELSPLDAMYLSVNQWRSECRRKERETLLLYQRYVHTYGSEHHLLAAGAGGKGPPPPDFAQHGYQPGTFQPGAVGADSLPTPPPLAPPSRRLSDALPQSVKTPTKKSSNSSWSIQSDPAAGEDTAAAAKTTTTSSHWSTRSNPGDDNKNLQPAADMYRNDKSSKLSATLFSHQAKAVTPDHRRTTPTTGGPQVSQQAAAIERGLQEHVAKHSMTALAAPSISTLGRDQTFQGLTKRQERAQGSYSRRQLERRGVDAKARLPGGKTTVEAWDDGNPGKVVTGPALPPGRFRSAGAVVGTWTEAEEEEQGGAVPVSPFSLQVTLADDLARERDDGDYDNDLFSLVSGLTSIDSAVTREICWDAETHVTDFLAQEREAIRKMMQEEEEEKAANGYGGGSVQSTTTSFPSEIGSVGQQAAEQAEQLAEQMRSILEEFQEQQGTGVAAAATKSPSPRKQPRELETPESVTNQKWMVYYDETYQREYYHETVSNRSQWEKPEFLLHEEDGSDILTPAPASPEPLLSHQQVLPDWQLGLDSNRRGSLRDKYQRRRRRRQRTKRRVMIALVAVTVVAAVGGTLWKYDLLPVSHLTGQAQRQMAEEALARAQADQRLAEEQQARKAAEALARAEREKLERERQLQVQAEEARRQEEEEEGLRQAEEARLKQLYLKRPWACNIPLSYIVHGRCRRLASENPLFNAQVLVNSMMQ